MDLVGTKFGGGPKELGGCADLMKHFKLWPHHEFFCKKSLPSTISETPYLRNVVGETYIKKGEGMELDQLFQNTSHVERKHADMHPFNLVVLREAFKMQETTPLHVLKLNGESKDKKKHKKHKREDKEKFKDRKHRHHPKDGSTNKDEKLSNGFHDVGSENLQRLHDKTRKLEGNDDPFRNPKMPKK